MDYQFTVGENSTVFPSYYLERVREFPSYASDHTRGIYGTLNNLASFTLFHEEMNSMSLCLALGGIKLINLETSLSTQCRRKEQTLENIFETAGKTHILTEELDIWFQIC